MASQKDSWGNKEAQALLDAFSLVRNQEEMRCFLRDLLTEKEIEEFSLRYKVAKMLSQGVPYTTIVEETGMSSTTIARVQKWLTTGMGGYQLILGREKQL